MNLIEVVEVLIEKVKKEYPDDISIIAICGSYVYHDTHPKSDLDFYFIPKTDRGYEAACQFIIDGIGFDFWGISWDRIENIARFGERIVSIVADAQVVYCGSHEDLERFECIRKGITTTSEKKEFMLSKAAEKIKDCYVSFYHMTSHENNLSIIKQHAYDILMVLAEVVSLINQTYIQRGYGKLITEIQEMKKVPIRFRKLFDDIMNGEEKTQIIEDCKSIVEETRQLINDELKKTKTTSSYQDAFHGFYEETKSLYNKIIRGCETGNFYTVYIGAASLQVEMGIISYFAEGYKWISTVNSYADVWKNLEKMKLPDLLGEFNRMSLADFKEVIVEHERRLTRFLKENGLIFTEFKDMYELKSYIRKGSQLTP